MTKCLLGIDIGGTFVKAAVFDLSGKQISVAKERGMSRSLSGGREERDMDGLRESVFRVIASALRSLPEEGEVVGIGLSGHGKGLYVLDKEHRVFTAGILSTDSRAEETCARLRAGEAGKYVRENNYQDILACQPICLLRWLKDCSPDEYNAIGTVFSAKDYVRFCLTGEIHAEITDLSGTNLLNLRTRSYDPRLLDLCGISEISDCLPPILGSFAIAGCVTEDVAKKTGLASGIPVCGGMFDIDACGLASGLIDERAVAMIAGTWAINEYISEAPVAGEKAPQNSLYCLDGYYLSEESSPTSSANLQWWMDKIDRTLTYEKINALVAGIGERENVYFIPYVTGGPAGSRASGALVGLERRCGKEHILRAIFEGVVYNARMQFERLTAHREPPDRILLSGGVTNSDIWVQLFADILQFPVEIPKEERELGCFGAALAAGTATGNIADVKFFLSGIERKRYEPNVGLRDVYDKKYRTYLQLLDALQGFWKD